MKFFRKYNLVLPPAALLYGISAWNIKYPEDGLPQTMMDDLVNGWLLADREIDFKYANRKAWKYIKFVGVWVLSLGIIISILEHKIAFID